jgi:hypothetical protein
MAVLGALILGAHSGTSICVPPIEEVMEFRAYQDRILLVVMTHGCTEKSDFHVEIDKVDRSRKRVVLSLRRLRPDECKGFFPSGRRIEYTREELGISRDETIELRRGNASKTPQ